MICTVSLFEIVGVEQQHYAANGNDRLRKHRVLGLIESTQLRTFAISAHALIVILVHFGRELRFFIDRLSLGGLFGAGGHFVPGLGGAQVARADVVERGGGSFGLGLAGAVAIEDGGGVRRRSPDRGRAK